VPLPNYPLRAAWFGCDQTPAITGGAELPGRPAAPAMRKSVGICRSAALTDLGRIHVVNDYHSRDKVRASPDLLLVITRDANQLGGRRARELDALTGVASRSGMFRGRPVSGGSYIRFLEPAARTNVASVPSGDVGSADRFGIRVVTDTGTELHSALVDYAP
jgi:hypothetical protein